MSKLAALAAGALMAASGSVQAANILLNPGFEASNGTWPPIAPTSWTYYGPGSTFYIEPAPRTGNNSYKSWGAEFSAGTPNWTGIYQNRPALPGAVFTADAWFITPTGAPLPANTANRNGWIEVTFRNAGDTILAFYKSATFTIETIGAGTWVNLPVTNVCDLSGNITGSTTQLLAPAGTATVRYQFVNFQTANAGGDIYIDDTMLNQVSGPLPPAIGQLVPGSKLLANAAGGLSFKATSPTGATIDASGIQVTLNGSNISAQVVVSGPAADRTVTYSGLKSNTVYSVAIQVTDSLGLSTTSGMEFDTYAPLFVWEAEDWDFDNGVFINNPEFSTDALNPNTYFGKVGVEGVDKHDLFANGDHFYRATDPFASTTSGDLPRDNFVAAGATDYKTGWFDGGEWLNYTRSYPTGLFNIYGRAGGGAGAATVTLSKVLSGFGTTNQTTTNLGTFSFVGRGWSSYDYVPLRDTFGNPVAVTLGGQSTLRITTGGGADFSFFILIPGRTDLPIITGTYPDGTKPFQSTNKLVFRASSASTTIPNSGIKLTLNGVDVSSGLVITGTSLDKTVTYNGLGLNGIYSANIQVTDANGQSTSTSPNFDTFSQANYMVEAEDYDFTDFVLVGGDYVEQSGLFFDNPVPSAVWANGSFFGRQGKAGVDYYDIVGDGDHLYRSTDLMATPVAEDFLRDKILTAQASDPAVRDYKLGWFGYPEWANYTRTYPAGKYLVYGRFAGNPGSGFSIYLDQVTSGAGTTNQVTQRLGRFGAVANGWQNFAWVPLRDMDLGLPVAVTLNGKATLRLATTGNVDPNYFMLVPAATLQLTATRSGGNMVLSFPTTANNLYRVFYKDDLATGVWTLLTTVQGDGSVKSLPQPATGARRFYQVISP